MDDLATRATTNYARREFTEAYLEKLTQQKRRACGETANELCERFWREQIDYTLGVEGDVLTSYPRIAGVDLDLAFAAILSTIELSASFLVVTRLGFLDNAPLPFLGVTATLPVAITWLASRVQAQWFGIPNYAVELLRKYAVAASNSTPLEEFAIASYRTLSRLNAGVEAILDERRNSQHPTLELHLLNFDIEKIEAGIETAERKYRQTIVRIKCHMSATSRACRGPTIPIFGKSQGRQ